MATSRGKSRGSPHHYATETRPPHWLGKGQSRGHGTYCHYLHPAILGSSTAADSTYCTPQSCLGSSVCHCSPARAAGPRAALAPSVTAWSRLLQQGISPGQSARLGTLGLVLGGSASTGSTCSFVPSQGGQGTLRSPCMRCVVQGCWLLPAPGSSPEQILC